MNLIDQLQEHMSSVLAQGLRLVSPDELDGLTQEFSALNLAQPAALLTHIQQHVVSGNVEPKDAESFIKVQQILTQAEIRLSDAGTIEKGELQEVLHGVYVPSDDLKQAKTESLDDILMLSDPFLRGHQLMEYFRKVSYDELAQSLEIVWFDYALSGFIAEGLKTRPEEAINLTQIALKHKNQVIWRTALKVLETVEKQTAYTHKVLSLLTQLAEEANKPLRWPELRLLQEIIARTEGSYEEYLSQKQNIIRTLAANLKHLESSKKNERAIGIFAVSRAQDHYFTDVLIKALVAENDKKNIRSLLHALVDIKGFEAIPYIAQMLGGEYTKLALETLSRFGDRSALTFVLSHLEPKAIPAAFRDTLLAYGDLVFRPLLHTIKSLDDPAAYKKAFASIFTLFRSTDFVLRLVKEAEQEPEFAEKVIALMRKLYPKQYKQPGKKQKSRTTDAFAESKPLLMSLLGGQTLEIPRLSGLLLSPDGDYLLTSAHGRGVEIWSTAAWKKQTSLNMEGYPYQFTLSPDGQYLLAVRWVSSRRGCEIEIWEFGIQNARVGSFTCSVYVNVLGMTSDNACLLVGGEPTLKVFEFGTWREVTELHGYEGRVSYIRSIPNRKLMMVGDWQGWLNVWDETTWNQTASLKSDSWAPKFVDLSADGNLLMYGGYIGIKAWETQTWREIISLAKPKHVDCLALTPDSRYVVVGTGKKLRVLEFGSWKEVLTLASDLNILNVAVTHDGQHIITFENNRINVWNFDPNILNYV